MRKELEAFIEESFAGLPPSPETEQAKAQVRKQLEADAAVYRAKGMAPWAADQHAMLRFGAVAGPESPWPACAAGRSAPGSAAGTPSWSRAAF